MGDIHRCNRCGNLLPSDAPEGTCPACMLRAGLEPDTRPPPDGSAGEDVTFGFEPVQQGHVLESLARSIGPIPRVLLPDTAPYDVGVAEIKPSSDAMPAPGERGDRYQLFGEIARGGMGVVLKGRDPDLGRDLAVKILLESHEHKPEMVCRFVEEAQIGGQLQHPGIVPVYELGAFADRRPYFTMKLVKGRTLALLLAERQSPAHDLPRFLSIFEAICQTVAYAHARGVIHRDLKPANVMVGSFGEVQVMDWGLAKVLKDGSVADQPPSHPTLEESVVATMRSGSNLNESQAGSVLGTPAYMAPEQAAGEGKRVDRRADVFGLGSILCEILTGGPAFTGKSTLDVLRQAMRGETADALARLDGCGAEVELIALAKDCLAVEPEDRPRDAKVVAERITGYLAGIQERVHAAERERAVAVVRVAEERRRRKVQLALAASVLAFTTLGGLSTTYYLQQRAARAAAGQRIIDQLTTLQGQALAQPDDIQRWEVALAAVEQADPTGDLKTRGQVLAMRKVIQAGRDAAHRDKVLLDRLVDIRSAKADDPDGSITDHDYAQAFREASIDVANLPPAEVGVRIKARPASVVTALAGALDDWAAIRRGKGANAAGALPLSQAARVADPDPWRSELRTTLDQFDSAVRLAGLQALAKTAKFHELGPISLQLLGTGLNAAGDRTGAESVLRRAQQRHPRDVWINFDLGSVLTNLSPPDEAIRFLTAARAIRPETAHQLAHALERRGNSDEAIAVFRDLKEIRPGNEYNLGCLGDLLKAKGLFQEASEAFEAAAVAGREAVRLKPDAAAAHASLARPLMRQDKLDEAIAELRTVKRLEPNHIFNWPGSVQVDLLEVRAGLNQQQYHLDLAIAYVEHTRAHELQNSNPRAAEPLFRQALEGYRKIQGPDGPMTIELTNDLANLLDRTGRSAEAEPLRDALERAGKQSRPDERRMLDSIHNRAHALAASKPGEAKPLFRQALEGYRKMQGPDGALTLDLTNDLANVLDRTGRSAEAEPLRDALERARKQFRPDDPRTLGIIHNRAHALEASKPGEAEPLFRQALEGYRKMQGPDGELTLDLTNDLALLLDRTGRSAEAEPLLRLCLSVREKNHPDEYTTFNTRSQLGGSLLGQKKYAEAEPLIVSGYEGMKAREAQIPPIRKRRLTDAAERVVKLYEARGKKDDAAKWRATLAKAERLDAAQVAYDQKKFAVAARLWAEALASEEKLGDDRQTQHRYNAARAAALAAAGQGEDAAKLDDAAKAQLRRQALDWLKAELAAWGKLFDPGPPRARLTIMKEMLHWQKDTDLAGIRDAAALARLPADEQKEWQALWARALELTTVVPTSKEESVASPYRETLTIGDEAPAISVSKWVKGDPIDRLDSKKTYVVEFWATWCGPCRSSIAHLTELQKKYKDKGVTFIGVSVWEQDQDAVAPFVQEMGDKMDYTVAIDDVPKGEKGSKGKMADRWMEAADQHGIPTAFIVRDGKVAWIGHTMEMDKPLEESSAKEFDIQVAARPYRDEKERKKKLAVAQVAYDHKQFAVATQLWAEALASDPRLGDDRPSQHRYNAARAAALATGEGKDEPPLDDAAKAKLRRQALDWLKAELNAWSHPLDSGPPQDRPTVGAKLRDWQTDSALAGIRDAAALAKLPAEEQKEWQALWARVPELRTVVPTSKEEGQNWRYTTKQPADGWQKADFDDKGWQQGVGGFGTQGTSGAVVRTEWKTDDIWLRREFTMPDGKWDDLLLRVHHDDDAEVYVNGVPALKVPGAVGDYEEMPLTAAARTALEPGKNVFAVHCHQTAGPQYIDVGIAAVKGNAGRLALAVNNLLGDLRQAGYGRLADELTQEIRQAQHLLELLRARLTGHVIVGRVICEEGDDPSRVVAQMRIHSEGYFVGPVKDSYGPLGFRRQGYLPAEITPAGEPGSVEYVGEVRLKRMPKTMGSAVRGKIVLEGEIPATPVAATLSIRVGPSNTPSGGTNGSFDSVNANVSRSGEFSASGLSPTDYSLYITAPGYLSQVRTFTLKPGETHDADTIALERPKQVAISYRVASSPPFTEARTERQTVLGGDRFRANRQAPQDSSFDLQFPQNNGKISFEFGYWCSIADLGPGKLEDFLKADPTSAKFTNPRNVVPQSGHVYFLDQQTLNHWVLFKLEFDENAPRKEANRAEHRG